MKKNLNQKLINLIEYYNLINSNMLLSNSPIKRTYATEIKNVKGSKLERLNKLKQSITLIKNCELKKKCKKSCFWRW